MCACALEKRLNSPSRRLWATQLMMEMVARAYRAAAFLPLMRSVSSFNEASFQVYSWISSLVGRLSLDSKSSVLFVCAFVNVRMQAEVLYIG